LLDKGKKKNHRSKSEGFNVNGSYTTPIDAANRPASPMVRPHGIQVITQGGERIVGIVVIVKANPELLHIV
jgi:hypothetical protein